MFLLKVIEDMGGVRDDCQRVMFEWWMWASGVAYRRFIMRFEFDTLTEIYKMPRV